MSSRILYQDRRKIIDKYQFLFQRRCCQINAEMEKTDIFYYQMQLALALSYNTLKHQESWVKMKGKLTWTKQYTMTA